jgi:hypothetical protein
MKTFNEWWAALTAEDLEDIQNPYQAAQLAWIDCEAQWKAEMARRIEELTGVVQ